MTISDPDDLGQLERLDDRVRVTFTRRYRCSAPTLWRALTEPDHLAAWFPTTIEGDRVAGARLHFGFRNGEAPPFDGELVVFEPPSVLELRWGDELLRFELGPRPEAVELTFSATFEELGKVARDGAGWHACLDLLGYEVAGRVPPWSSPDRWREVHPAYVDRFGPEASAIGPPEEWERVHGAEATRPDER
jgi:uncharacterized protein YndB with AHSA1/START domain